MMSKSMNMARSLVRKVGFDIVSTNDPAAIFHSHHYLRHNARRLEHLASLRIAVAGMSVLEVGAGIGDHSQYFMDRDCSVTITEARAENLEYLKTRYPQGNVRFLDMDRPSLIDGSPFDVVHCYGLLYHLNNAKEALEFLAQSTKRLLFLETCVSFGGADELNPTAEKQSVPSQAYSGTGCRPTRAWLYRRLQGLFGHVYVPKTQPNHEEFPLDWNAPDKHHVSLQRAIFIASREKLDNEILIPSLINEQTRHE